jgi:hypothetical protein
MLPFSINWREVAIGVTVFLLVILGFGILSAAIHWPRENDGWPLAVAIAAVIAFLPVIARALSFLQQSGASLEGPLGIKLNFSAAAAVATVSTAKVTENLVTPGVQIFESSFKELNEAALRATDQTVVVIDLEDGQAWYKTRLFALAATAKILHAPRLLVLVGQRGGQSMQAGGWIRPAELVRAVVRSDPRYGEVWQHAQAYLHRLQAQLIHDPNPDPQYPRLSSYQASFEEAGPASIMFILVHQMREPDSVPASTAGAPQAPTPTPLESHDVHPWISLREAELMLDPWLGRDTIDLNTPQAEQVAAVMAATGDIILTTRDGRYSGLIDVARAERDLLRQLLTGPKHS